MMGMWEGKTWRERASARGGNKAHDEGRDEKGRGIFSGRARSDSELRKETQFKITKSSISEEEDPHAKSAHEQGEVTRSTFRRSKITGDEDHQEIEGRSSRQGNQAAGSCNEGDSQPHDDDDRDKGTRSRPSKKKYEEHVRQHNQTKTKLSNEEKISRKEREFTAVRSEGAGCES